MTHQRKPGQADQQPGGATETEGGVWHPQSTPASQPDPYRHPGDQPDVQPDVIAGENPPRQNLGGKQQRTAGTPRGSDKPRSGNTGGNRSAGR